MATRSTATQMWNLAIEMNRHNTRTMMINNPLHICGRREMLPWVLQKVINLGFDV